MLPAKRLDCRPMAKRKTNRNSDKPPPRYRPEAKQHRERALRSLNLEIGTMKYEVVFGLTVQAYGCAEVEADSINDLRQKVEELIDDNGGDENVEIAWDTADDYRVVIVRDESNNEVDFETAERTSEP